MSTLGDTMVSVADIMSTPGDTMMSVAGIMSTPGDIQCTGVSIQIQLFS